MPCYDGRENIAASSLAEKNRELQNRLDRVTRAACELARFYRLHHNDLAALSSETRGWVTRHEEFDRKRKLNRRRK